MEIYLEIMVDCGSVLFYDNFLLLRFLSGHVLKNYKGYQLKCSYTNRIHYREVQCTRTITLLY